MIRLKQFLLLFILGVFFLGSCQPAQVSPTPSPEEILRDLGVNNQSDFETLSPCDQVKIYAFTGAQNLDIDHGIAVVPKWMDEVISDQSKEDIGLCIAKQGELLVSQWEDVYNSTNINLSHQVLALVYKADDLNIVSNLNIRHFISIAVCDKKIFYRENIALIYYVGTQSDMQNIPDPNGLIDLLCN